MLYIIDCKLFVNNKKERSIVELFYLKMNNKRVEIWRMLVYM